jgi:hypothetical protein
VPTCWRFLLVSRELVSGFRLLDRSGHVDFVLLTHRLGQEDEPGPFVALKDTAHGALQARRPPRGPAPGQFLDWSVGLHLPRRHELREDAYQQQNYAP